MSDEKKDIKPAVTQDKKKSFQPIVALDPVAAKQWEAEEMAKAEGRPSSSGLDGTLDMILKSIRSAPVQRMAFDVDPRDNGSWGSFYKLKSNLTPDHVIKKITGPSGDDLVCQILQARANMIASFGRPRSSRFAIGFEFQKITENDDTDESKEEREKTQERLDHLKEVLWNCGYRGLDDTYFAPNLSQFLKMITRDGLAYGRFAVEFIYAKDKTGKERLHSFRAADAGTIYRIVPRREQEGAVRKEALNILAQLKAETYDKGKYTKDEYKWTQVVDFKPVQVFTDKEMVVHNLYPTTNIEYNGYPLTPIDQALNAITTHINITLHNKLYFQNGRAARGMLVINSDSVDETAVQRMRSQFHQSINSVNNSWRMPVFGVAADEKITWQSIDIAGRDQEFQYLSDNNARVILSAFQMSPEELPGYAHLARGTNTQALSESDNEWKLTAARDVGLRPLIYDIQDFFNTHVMPKLDEEISKRYQLVLAGLDHDSPEKESTRLGQDMPIHMTYNEVLEKVEKEKLAKEVGGDFPLNPSFQNVIQSYMTVGNILEAFFGLKGAGKDPRYDYVRDPFWIQNQQLLMQKAQMAMQNVMMQQQAMQAAMGGGQPPQDPNDPTGGGSPDGGGGGDSQPAPQDQQAPDGATEQQKAEIQASNLKKREDWNAANYALMEKSITANQNSISKMILSRHKSLVDGNMKKWRQESRKALSSITSKLKP